MAKTKSLKLFAMHGSPRTKGNSETLLHAFIDEFKKNLHDVQVEILKLPLNIAPCLGCDKCISGVCVRKDIMLQMYGKIKKADLIVLSAPVYFYGFPSHVKAMIDRCQLFYNLKYRRKLTWRESPGLGVLLSCGASRGTHLFDGMVNCAKYWFDALDVQYGGKVVVRGVDEKGDIDKFPEAFVETRLLAEKTASKAVSTDFTSRLFDGI